MVKIEGGKEAYGETRVGVAYHPEGGYTTMAIIIC